MKRKRPDHGNLEPIDQASIKQNPESRIFNIDFLVEPHRCEICNKEISRSVMILCKECGILLCLPCLKSGKETDKHHCNDDYFVLDSLQYSVLSPDWTTREELMLMKGVIY